MFVILSTCLWHWDRQITSEYDRALEEKGDRRQAEKELESRIAHVKTLNIRPLMAKDVNRYKAISLLLRTIADSAILT